MDKRTDESLMRVSGPGATPETTAIRADIERTRAEMTRTVDAIEQRLSPAHIKEQAADVKDAVIGQFHEAKDQIKDDIANEIRHAKMAVREATVGRVEHMVHDVKETVSDAGTSVLDTIKENPIPAALVAVGLGWLLMSNRRGSSSFERQGYPARYGYARSGYDFDEYGAPRGALPRGARRVKRRVQRGVSSVQQGASEAVAKVEGVAHDVGEKGAQLAQDAKDAALHAAEDVKQKSRQLVRGAGMQIDRAERTFEGAMRDNPLAVGAVAIAIGAAIGLALPHTQREDEWLGGAKGKLLDKAEGVAREALHKVEEKVDDAAQALGGGDQQQQQQNRDQGRNGLGANARG